MKIILQRISATDYLWYCAYSFFVIYYILSKTFFYQYFMNILDYKIVLVFCMSILLTRELFLNKLTRRLMLVFLFCGILMIIVMHSSSGGGANSVACIVLFAFAARNIPFKQIAKHTIFISEVLLAFVILCAFSDIIPNYVRETNGRTRYYLGFLYALYPSAIMFNITALSVYSKKEKLKISNFVFLILVNYFIFQYTDSRLSFYTSILLLVFAAILRFKPKCIEERKVMCNIASFSFPICMTVSVALTIAYGTGTSWIEGLNILLGKRLSLGLNSLITNGVTLFGQNLSWIGAGLNAYGERSNEQYTWVDSMYIQVLQHFGIVFCLVLMVILTLAMRKCIKYSDYWMLVILSIFALHGIIDDLIIYVQFNTFWIAIGGVTIKSISDFRKNKLRREQLMAYYDTVEKEIE